MNTFTLVFVALLVLGTTLQLWLLLRQEAHVRAHRGLVPGEFSERISLEAHQKAADYSIARAKFGRFEVLFGAVLAALWTLGGGLEWLTRFWARWEIGVTPSGVGMILSALLIMGLLDLPGAVYRTFVLEARFRFNRTTPRRFALDMGIQGLLFLLLVTPLAWLVLWLMDGEQPLWWVYVWATWMAFTLLLTWAFPVFIAPLFNRFTPLEDMDLGQRVQRQLRACGYTARGVFIMDGSRRSSHGNAYFTGFGGQKRVVFFDTLISRLSPDEIEAVLAHELGHCKLRHMLHHMLVTAVLSLAGLALLDWLTTQAWFYTGLGVSSPSHAGALLLFLLVVPVFTVFLHPLFSFIMRQREFEADEYAVKQTSRRSLAQALVKLYRDNASTLTPDPLYSIFHDTHPPASVRLAHISSKIGR